MAGTAKIGERKERGLSMIPERLNEITDLQARMLCDQLRERIVDSVYLDTDYFASLIKSGSPLDSAMLRISLSIIS